MCEIPGLFSDPIISTYSMKDKLSENTDIATHCFTYHYLQDKQGTDLTTDISPCNLTLMDSCTESQDKLS